MSRLMYFMLSIVCGLNLTCAFAREADDEAVIRQIISQQVIAWNAGNGALYAKHFAPDGAFTNLFGMVMYGASAFGKRHSEILAMFYKGTTKQHAVRRIRFVTLGRCNC
jgi:uncharacterized protein (TIGR02246 family)